MASGPRKPCAPRESIAAANRKYVASRPEEALILFRSAARCSVGRGAVNYGCVTLILCGAARWSGLFVYSDTAAVGACSTHLGTRTIKWRESGLVEEAFSP